MPSIDTNDLKRYLASLEREDRYRVVDTLKSTDAERTELVYLPDSVLEADAPLRMKRGFQHLYVRKYIESASHLGSAYQRIFDQQHSEADPLESVPHVYECYETDEHLIVVMEYLSGETLDRAVSRLGAGSDLACRLLPPICDAVASIHERFDPPLIHRDLKPSNVIVQDARAVLIDLGIARDFKEGAETDTLLFGTRSFSPPEQFGYKQTTVRSDVYALGMLLYFCLTGTIPSASTHDDRFPGADIPEPMRAVLMCATEFDPEKRFASARALKNAFLSACPAHPIPRKAPGLSAPAADVAAPSPGNRPLAAAPSGTRRNARRALGRRFAPKPAEPERFSILGKIWNGLLVASLFVLLLGCFSSFVNPTPQNQAMPIWHNAIGFLVVMPVLFASTALLIADKRRIAVRFPALRKLNWWKWIASYAVLAFALVCILGLIRVIALR
ncbi:hypothetical protein JI75_08600 [Berryella intestinalis]|uniref:non-specific serine/threonine protein kinase n=1 Tax=Berryella intestinalis TaxID=1531429 RepID=A0A0A8B5K8_9ACTN|nr:serine/threonine-protein kinase [Berryella intestinalis]AJC12700.1 hypothetical protein JI75_08600 [Berryella intestinalis]